MTQTSSTPLPQEVFNELVITTWRVKVSHRMSGIPDMPVVADFQRSIYTGELDDGLPDFSDRMFAMMKAHLVHCRDENADHCIGETRSTHDDLVLILSNEDFLRGLDIDELYTEQSKKHIASRLGFYNIWWRDLKTRGANLKHPIVPFIQAWFKRKPDRLPREYGAGFMPTRLAAHDRNRRAFGLAARIEQQGNERVVLPGFGSARRMPALPEELLRLGQVTKGGRGVKLPLRATLAGIEFAPPYSRNGFYSMPVREFLNRIWPGGYPRGGRWYSALVRAAEAQAAGRVPYIDPDTGDSGSTIPVLLWRIPNTVEGELRVAVDLPPKSDQGAPITDNLYTYGATQTRAFYALLQLTVDWWQPGRTRVPVNKRRSIWVQLTDAERKAHTERYEPYNREQIVELTAPLTVRRNMREAYSRGIETLKRLDAAKEIVLLPDGNGTWRIMPPTVD